VNSVALIGRLTADPQSHAGEKHESCTFRLGVLSGVGLTGMGSRAGDRGFRP
jgi:hypothetical protein